MKQACEITKTDHGLFLRECNILPAAAAPVITLR